MQSKVRSASSFFRCSLLALAVAACGADERAAETGSGTRDIPGVVLIEDAEDGDATLMQDAEAEILGYWYTYDDRQECVHPDFTSNPPNTVACGSESCAASGDDAKTQPPTRPYGGDFTTAKYADHGETAPMPEGDQKSNEFGIRVTGGNNTYFGAGVGVALNNPGTPAAYDLAAHGFTGIRFLAKSGTPGQALKLRVKIKDAFSEPLGGKCNVRQNVCDASGCQCCDEAGMNCDVNLPQGCHDDPIAPAARTAATDTWQLYEIPFSEFVREDWGTHKAGQEPPSTALDTTAAYQLQFQVQTDATPATTPLAPFVLWIDNIGLMTGAPTPTPTGMLMPTSTPAAGGSNN